MHLDSEIGKWVLIPIMLIMLLVGVLKNQLAKYSTINSAVKMSRKQIREAEAIKRCVRWRRNADYVPFHAFQQRKEFFISNMETYLEDPKAKVDANPLNNPEALKSMMQSMNQSSLSFIPQTIIMAWISYFFDGFIVVKLPFPLTNGFKTMLQRGIHTSNLDVSWVSSISWYFLNLFGLNGIFEIIFGESAVSQVSEMTNFAAPTKLDARKILSAEKELLQIHNHKWKLE